MSTFWEMIIAMAIKALIEWLTTAKPKDAEKVARNLKKAVKAYNA